MNKKHVKELWEAILKYTPSFCPLNNIVHVAGIWSC
jgi:hypothetical protein